MIPVPFICEPVVITASSEKNELWGWTGESGELRKENALIRTVDFGSAVPAPGAEDIHAVLEKNIQITHYIYNRNVRTAVRDFYRVNNATITEHTCGAERPDLLPITCPVLNTSFITGNWTTFSQKMAMDRTMQSFEYVFMANPMSSGPMELTVNTKMSSTVTLKSYPPQPIYEFNVSDKYSCRNKNPLTFTYPAIIDMGSVRYGDTVTKDFTLEYRGGVGVLPDTKLTVLPPEDKGSTSTPLGSYNITLLLPNGSPYVFGEPITPSENTTLKILASPGSGIPATGQKETTFNIIHSFD